MKLKPFTTTALVCVTLFGAFTQVRGQDTTTNAPPADHHKGDMSPEGHMNALSQQLNLTEDQKTKVQAVFNQMRQQMQTAFETAKTNADTQLQTILKPEQYQQLQAMFQQHDPHFNQKGQGGGNRQGNEGQGGTGNQGGQNQGGSQNKR